MRTVDIIAAKRDGRELAEREIRQIVLDYSRDIVPDYQMSAFLMAVCIRGMSFGRPPSMTSAMVDSGRNSGFVGVEGSRSISTARVEWATKPHL